MAITTKGAPQDFTPVYNEMNFYFDSTNKLQPAFRYVFDLYKKGTAIKIAEFRGAPRPNDGYGIAKISNFLSPLVTRYINPTLTGNAHPVQNYIEYDLKVGEEYTTAWSYSDYEFHSAAGTPFNALVQLRQFTATAPNAHSFTVGSQINITQNDGGVLKPIISGLHTVVKVVDAWTIVIEIPFSAVGSGATVGGSIGYSDGRKTITRNLLTVSGTAFNGALSFLDFRVYNQDNYSPFGSPESVTRQMLTSLSNDIRLKETNSMLINIATLGISLVFDIVFQNSNGATFRKSLSLNTSHKIKQFQAGAITTGLTLESGSGALVEDDTMYYEFWADKGGEQRSRKYKVIIDRRCSIEDYEILFEDRLGSFIPFNFQLRSDKKINVSRQEYKKELGDLVTDEWSYGTTDEGTTTSNVTTEQEFMLRTDFMTRSEYELYELFISSPTHLININGTYVSCKVKTTSETTQGIGTRKLVRKDLMVVLSNEDKVNI